MGYVIVQGAGDLAPGEMKKFQVAGTDILVANLDGTFVAVANTCTHMGGSLADGVLEGHVVRCPRHGAQFDLMTGKNLGEAKLLFIKTRPADVKSYPVKVENGLIYVEID